ncbi:exopolysaccharide Pel transporter PelG [bacterium]|nr:exopolysaccharide Pel transporter PelG [bacterium]
MAGIGFKIENLLKKETFLDSLQAFFYSAFICAGPGIISISTIFLLNCFAPMNIDLYELTLLRTTITYIFAFSVIIIGLIYMPITRYAADKIYLKQSQSIIPIFNTSVCFILVIGTIFGFLFFSKNYDSVNITFLAIMIFLVINIMWILMMFLTILKSYLWIAVSFVLGGIATLFLGYYFGSKYDLIGYFLGYLLGQFTIVILLAYRVFIEFPSHKPFEKELFQFLLKNKTLICIGFFYHLAIWIDKIIFWYSPQAIKITPLMSSLPSYDTTVFIAYLTIIPSMILFFLKMETNFYKKYKNYYFTILQKGSLSEIINSRKQMTNVLKNNISMIIYIQGIITICLIIFTPKLINILHIQAYQIPVFRIIALGTFIQAIFFIFFIIILYFDFKKLALLLSIIFLISNAAFTYLTTAMDLSYTGYGYFASVLVSLICAFHLLNRKLKTLEYYVFAKQPI